MLFLFFFFHCYTDDTTWSRMSVDHKIVHPCSRMSMMTWRLSLAGLRIRQLFECSYNRVIIIILFFRNQLGGKPRYKVNNLDLGPLSHNPLLNITLGLQEHCPTGLITKKRWGENEARCLAVDFEFVNPASKNHHEARWRAGTFVPRYDFF